MAGLTAGGFILRSVIRGMGAFDLAGKVVAIIGGSRGLGLVLAREFAKQGARLVICARDKQELDRARDDLQSRSAEVLTIECDVRKRSDVEEMVATIHDHYGRIDVLVNNAGVIEVGPLEVMTLEDFRVAIDTHFWGPVYATLAVLPEAKTALRANHQHYLYRWQAQRSASCSLLCQQVCARRFFRRASCGTLKGRNSSHDCLSGSDADGKRKKCRIQRSASRRICFVQFKRCFACDLDES